ncbi:MAG: PspC domain-containing protein [Rikenellaceae bacterium]
MKVTKNINIAGFLFVIDDDACNYLSAYLKDVSQRFADENERREVMNDIEWRFSDIFREKGISEYKVVDIEVVKYAISIIGTPDVFGAKEDVSAGESGYSDSKFSEEPTPIIERRKLMRDGEDKMLGGVCSGFAAYLALDVVLVRVALFLMIFFMGTSLFIYLFAWIIIPLAKTEREKVLMEEMKAQRD